MRSMTGYSKLNFEDEKFKIKIEIKSVNNKNLNTKLKTPYTLNFMENQIRTQVSEHIKRGYVELRIDFEEKIEDEDVMDYNKNLANSYMKLLNNLEENYQENFSNKLDLLIKYPNLIVKNDVELNQIECNNFVTKKMGEALMLINEMKNIEGENLKMYFKRRLDILNEKVSLIKELKEKVVETYRKKLLERLNTIKKDIQFKEEDILKEILLFTDRSDVSEEISRLESHIKQFSLELNTRELSVGKKLDFILQEMFRELNTTGVKCQIYEISKLVVEAKSEVEKIREQVMNIE